MRFYHMASDMSRNPDSNDHKRGVPALVTIIGGVIALNLIAAVSPNLAVAVAGGVVLVSLVLFVSGVIRRK